MDICPPSLIPTPQITHYQAWLARERGLHFDSYDALWRWGTSNLAAFWQSLWDYSSGTTGLPKPIVHGHGGVMLEALNLDSAVDRFPPLATPHEH